MGTISKYRRYVIDKTGLDPLCLGELEVGVQCFGEFGASGRARTMEICRCVRELHTLTLIFPYSTIWGAEGRGKTRKN